MPPVHWPSVERLREWVKARAPEGQVATEQLLGEARRVFGSHLPSQLLADAIAEPVRRLPPMEDVDPRATAAYQAAQGVLLGEVSAAEVHVETLRSATEPFTPARLMAALEQANLGEARRELAKGVLRLLSDDVRVSAPTGGEEPLAPGVPGGESFLFVVPSQETYASSSWKWDLGFAAQISLRLAELSPEPKVRAALNELAKGCLAAAYQNQLPGQPPEHPNGGMTPHMNFRPGGDDEELWLSARHSSITQPPVLPAIIAALSGREARAAFYPAVKAELEWWLSQRLDGGLPFIVHPWESGRDAAVDMDAALSPHVGPARGSFAKRLTKNPGRKAPEQLLGRGNLLMAQQELAAKLGVAPDDLPASEAKKLFMVKPPDLAALLVNALEAGAKLAAEQHDDAAANKFGDAAATMRQAIHEQQWDAATGFFYSLGAQGRLPEKVGSAFIPLAAGVLSTREAVRLADWLSSPAFDTAYPIPTVATDDPRFVADDYWRGSTWINVNFLTLQGLADYAERARSEGDLASMRRFAEAGIHLGKKTVELAGGHGFYEFYDSRGQTSESRPDIGCGPAQFAWSGLSLNALDLVERLEGLLAGASAA